MNSKKTTPSKPEEYVTIKPEDVPRGQENIGYLIRLAHHSLHDMIEKNMAPLGLTASQWHPIAIIGLSKADTPASVARLADVDTGAMTRTLDRLEAKAFLTRQRCEKDRRVIKLMLTEKGKQVNEQLLPSVAQALNHHLQGFTEQEVGQLKSLLTRMLLNANPDILKTIQENGMNG